MTPIEILALTTAILIITKLIVMIFKPRFFFKIAEKVIKYRHTLMIIYLFLAIIVGYYLLQELTIIQIAVAMLFASFVIKAILVNYTRGTLSLMKEAYFNTNWFVIIIMLLLAILILASLYT